MVLNPLGFHERKERNKYTPDLLGAEPSSRQLTSLPSQKQTKPSYNKHRTVAFQLNRSTLFNVSTGSVLDMRQEPRVPAVMPMAGRASRGGGRALGSSTMVSQQDISTQEPCGRSSF